MRVGGMSERTPPIALSLPEVGTATVGGNEHAMIRFCLPSAPRVVNGLRMALRMALQVRYEVVVLQRQRCPCSDTTHAVHGHVCMQRWHNAHGRRADE